MLKADIRKLYQLKRLKLKDNDLQKFSDQISGRFATISTILCQGGACVLAYREETGGKYMADHKAAMAKRFAHSGTFDGGRKQSAAPKHPDTR
jgi:hypothetical protein